MSLKSWQKIFDIRMIAKNILTIAFILFATAISAAYAGGGCDIVKDGLIACYPFNGNANDENGNGNNGTVNGAASVVNRFGRQNSAYKFDGMNNDIRIPDKPSQQISANRISISAWITLEKDIQNTQWRVVNKQQFWGAAWGLELFGNGYGYPSGYGSLYPGGYGYSVGQGNNLNFHNSDGSTYVNCTVSEVSLISGTTYHVAVAAENNVAKIYIDGNLIKTCQNMLGIPSAINSDIVIGSLSESSDFFFNGIIDDVRIYNRAISEAEIRQLYSSISAITASAGTGGTISPSGSVSVNCGESRTFSVTPAACYDADSVLVNGSAVTLTNGQYTFQSVTANQTISATFKQNPCCTYSVQAQIDAARQEGKQEGINLVRANPGNYQLLTQAQSDQAVKNEQLKWDANGDGRIGLEDIRPLSKVFFPF